MHSSSIAFAVILNHNFEKTFHKISNDMTEDFKFKILTEDLSVDKLLLFTIESYPEILEDRCY